MRLPGARPQGEEAVFFLWTHSVQDKFSLPGHTRQQYCNGGYVMEERKKILFAFRGDPLCFIHVLLNGLDLYERGLGGEIVVEGDAVTLIPEMAAPGHFLHSAYRRAREAEIIHGACRACSNKLGVAEKVEKEGVALVGDMANHPSMGAFIEQGYDIITF